MQCRETLIIWIVDVESTAIDFLQNFIDFRVIFDSDGIEQFLIFVVCKWDEFLIEVVIKDFCNTLKNWEWTYDYDCCGL